MFCRKDNFHIYSYLYSDSDFWKSIFFYFRTSPNLSLRIKLEKLSESYKFKYPNNEKFLSAAIYNRVKRFRTNVRSCPHRWLFLRPYGCNIAPGKDPVPKAASGNSENFGQRFSGADFFPSPDGSELYLCPTNWHLSDKGARSARPGGVLPSRTPFNLKL